MPFSQRPVLKRFCVLVACVILGMSILLSCKEDITEQGDVFSDAARRVEANLLPPIRREAVVVLRNLVHLLTALPELCSAGLARIGSFVSSVAVLGVPDEITFDEDDGAWKVTWRDAVLGDDDAQLTIDTDTSPVDITLTVQFLGEVGQVLRAVPFSLTPRTTLRTAGEPPSFAAGDVEGFFLFQNAATGEWTLRWRAVGSSKVFEGRISAPAVSRVIRRLPAGAPDVVSSLAVDTAARQISFTETTTTTDAKGFTFFVRPGERIRFRLRIGTEENALQEITRSQLRLGAEDQLLPADRDPAEFTLVSNVPSAVTGAPAFTPGSVTGTFIWQDSATSTCAAGVEDQWRLRFSKQSGQPTFSGTLRAFDDDGDRGQLRVTTVGGCPTGPIDDGGRRFTYDCSLSDDTESGYNVCVTAGKRLLFSPEVDEVRDPGLVFIGGEEAPPPAPDPFAMRFDIDLLEQGSSHNLVFSDGLVFLRGNNDEEGSPQLHPDQISLEPLCRTPGDPARPLQPRVRLTGEGDYATERFEGSQYHLEDVEFTDTNVDSLDDFRRFPDRGEIRLETRVDTEKTTMTLLTEQIEDLGDGAQSFIDIEMSAHDVLFTFPNEVIDLTVE